MGLIDYIFRLAKKPKEYPEKEVPEKEVSGKCRELLQWSQYLNHISSSDHFISRREYTKEMHQYAETMDFIISMDENDILEDYCRKNGFSLSAARDLYRKYQNMDEFVGGINDAYVNAKMTEEKVYLDNILKDIDPQISLDEDQRKVVLADEDYSLVIAGAGAGKTTTVAAKVKYLVEKQGVSPNQILIISFTNKAVKELRDKIQKKLDIPCPIATFHATGNAILHKNNPEQRNIIDGSKLYYCVQNYFREKVLRDTSVVNSLILFFASYFDAPYEGDDINHFFNHMANANYATMRSELDDLREEIIDRKSRKKITIQNEIVRSIQEVEIANFLYLHNIDYIYEPIYKYSITMSQKPYTPDFMIQQGEHVAYIEHFGITEDGKNFLYDEEELAAYKKAINDKVKLHRRHNTELIYTFSSFNDGRSISAHLEEKLLLHGFELSRRSDEEIVKKLVASEENKYINRLVFLVINFIRNFKVNGYEEKDFDKLALKTTNVRTKLFLNIAHACFLEYKKLLVENHAVDFEDMINESARVLTEVKEMKQKLDFKYLIVDEYQDISRQRFDLVKSFSEVTDAKIMAVGDDWQSIYAFSGSDITLFTRFEEKMGYARLMKIVRTYRNSQEVIDIAGNFIQKNTSQIRKSLLSPKHIQEPVIIYTYDSSAKDPKADRRSGMNYAMAYAVQTALEQIIDYNKREGKDSEKSAILLLGRFNFDGDRLARTGLFEYVSRGSKVKSVNYPDLDITFMTAHASKGLGYDNVIVINGRNETYGFPSKIEDDPVLSLVVKEDRSMQYAEERRLFYVAMTRTKNRVYFIAPEKNPSEFLLEIKREYGNVFLRGKWSEEEPVVTGKHTCPVCGFPLQLKYKPAYGLRLYICTNEPEVCSFMTSNLRGKKLSVMKCPDCYDGYLIVKSSGANGTCFLGCSNYKNNRQGCNKTVSMHEYYKMMGYDSAEIDESISQHHVWRKEKDVRESGNMNCQNAHSQKTDWQSGNCRDLDRQRTEKDVRESGNMNCQNAGPQKTDWQSGNCRDLDRQRTEKQSGNCQDLDQQRTEKQSVNCQDLDQQTKRQSGKPQAAEASPEEIKSRHNDWERELIEKTKMQEVDESRYPFYKEHNVLEIAGTVLQCLVSISAGKYYNDTILIRTLCGSSDQRILQDKLYLVPEYGRISYLDRGTVRKMVTWLIDRHYILETKGSYPVLHITNEGLHYKEHMTPGKMKSLAELLGGTEGKRKSNKANAGEKWSEEEDQRLVREFASGKSIPEIAVAHKRSNGAIRARLIKHGLMQ